MFSQVPFISLFSYFFESFSSNSLYGNIFKKLKRGEKRKKRKRGKKINRRIRRKTEFLERMPRKGIRNINEEV